MTFTKYLVTVKALWASWKSNFKVLGTSFLLCHEVDVNKSFKDFRLEKQYRNTPIFRKRTYIGFWIWYLDWMKINDRIRKTWGHDIWWASWRLIPSLSTAFEVHHMNMIKKHNRWILNGLFKIQPTVKANFTLSLPQRQLHWFTTIV